MAPLTFGYWDLRGLGQHIRLLLEYTNTEYVDKRYDTAAKPDESWFTVKHTLGLDFPNLPYFIDGDVKMTQSLAIMRIIAERNNMCGNTEEERIKVELTVNQCTDLRTDYVRLVYGPAGDYASCKAKYLEALPGKLRLFSNFLASCCWFAGTNLTFSDFIMYELLDIHFLFVPNCLDEFQNLKDFHKRFQELPAIKKFLSSSKFNAFPINGPQANWGGNK